MSGCWTEAPNESWRRAWLRRWGASSPTLGLGGELEVAAFAARYLVVEVGAERARFHESRAVSELAREFLSHLEESGAGRGFEEDLRVLAQHRPERMRVALGYVDAFLRRAGQGLPSRGLELAARMLCDGDLELRRRERGHARGNVE
ncbi:MAG: hypothetical protein QM756_40680 [Polyangiaceae bacterium]